ncbi:amidase [Acuticoccus mangrovi]|uniref:Amidase n=1 Tax=Acuticoccus mangrovi TaxID=2796142 RepID=A0A934MFK0_9HYPH|nr:amidase [Acuticoccus mangrovi]MBJ3775558.1 amidase [Acuticoccus mangrovi]
MGAVATGPIDLARPDWLAGTQSPRDRLEHYLGVIEARETEVRAFSALNVEGARQAADASTARYRAGRPLSGIDGLVIGVKDNLETLDMPTTFGSPIFAGYRPERDSAIAFALRKAGAVVLGKTTSTEFASSHPFHDTRNPHDASRTPGGSSSGSAAAVAAGMLPIAVGTQVIGSVLRPAGFCGVLGFKPTYGALNKGGASDAYSQHTLGLLAAHLADIWAVCHAVASFVGGDPGFPPFRGGALPADARRPDRLAVVETAGWAVAEPGAREAFERAVEAIAAQGVEIVRRADCARLDRLEETIADARTISLDICRYEGLWPFSDMALRHRGLMSESMRHRVDVAEAMSPDDYIALLDRREAMRSALLTLSGEVDGFLTLSNTGPAPVGLATTGNSIFNVPASALRVPAISLPLLRVDGLPVGLQLLGFPHQDRALSSTAGWLLGAL